MQKKFTLAELCKNLDVVVYGDKNCQVDHVCTIQNGKKNGIAFLMNPQYKQYLSTTKASAVILTASDLSECQVNAVVSPDPYFTCSQIANFFLAKPDPNIGIHPSAVVGEHCKIHASVRIGANCVIGNHVTLDEKVVVEAGCIIGNNCIIGANSRLESNSTIYYDVKIGKRSCISGGVVIGADGFGLAKHKGVWHKIPQLGSVIIGDDVEIGANSTIDRGAIEDTVIDSGTKIDNQVQIAHNVRIGKNTAIAGCVGISGSTKIGNNCMVGGQTGFAGHLEIVDDVVITGGTEVTKSIRAPGIYSSGIGGLVSNKEQRKNTARVNRLEKLFEKVKKLEQEISILKQKRDYS